MFFSLYGNVIKDLNGSVDKIVRQIKVEILVTTFAVFLRKYVAVT